MYIEWKDDYCIGIGRIDDQHRKLIGYLNALYKTVSGGAPVSQSWELLDAFNRYAEEHFSSEERIAFDAGIPSAELENHKAEHEAYRIRLKGFQQAYMNKDKMVPVQLMAFLSKWWLSNILVKDMELGRLIHDQEAKQHG
ncbi:MAG: hemerythrin family protein [Hahellaceae bacterium]|nr:hemerythrin family protein [Hahellaceae bacterium]MCP5168383.1 hemerythrin family protein [Hahellaceae bacterium]